MKRPSAVAISSQTGSKFRGRGERRKAFSFAIASAIGSKSGPVERKKPKMRAGLLDGPSGRRAASMTPTFSATAAADELI